MTPKGDGRMEEYAALIFETRTAAARARALLAEGQIASFLRRRTVAGRGCVFTLLVPRSCLFSAAAILGREGIRYEMGGV